MSKYRVLIGSRSFGKASPEPLERLKAADCEVIPNAVGRAYNEAELLEAIAGVDAIVTGTDALTARVIERADRLKVISKHGIGTDNIDLEAAKRKGIVVAATPGVMDDSVADHTLCLLLALARHVVAAHTSTVAGEWKPRYGTELSGKQAGVIGLGRIGKKVALRLQAFGMRVVAHDPYPDRAFAEAHGIAWASLDELLASSDVICLHAPGVSRVLGPREFAVIKEGAYLINTSRGSLVDETALYEALKGGRLAGAGLDVFAEEPPTGSPLLTLPNVVVTPHQAGLTTEALIRMGAMAAENVLRVLRGEPPLFAVS